MKPVRLWARGIGRGALLAGSMLSAALPAVAQQTRGTSFVLSEHYVGAGQEPVPLETFLENPRQYLRSDAAYTVLFARFATILGQESVSEAELRTLHAEGRIELRDCVGGIETMYLTGPDAFWFVRDCYLGEQLIWFDVDATDADDWVLAASQGCLNPSRPKPVAEPTLESAPKKGVDWGVRNEDGRLHYLPDLDVCDCVHLPGVRSYQPGSGFVPADNW